MSRFDKIFDNARVVLTVAALLSLSGLLAWMTMPRQEDPTMPYRTGLVTVVYPGADPLDVERLVVEPLEDRLAEVEGVDTVEATARSGFAAVVVTLGDSVGFGDTDAVWQDVRDAIELARVDLPQGAMAPVLDDERFDQDSIVIAVTGGDSTIELAKSAEILRERLLRVPTVKRVNTFGDPGEQVTVELDDAAARRYGTSSVQILSQLSSRNVTTPGGSILIGERKVLVRPRADFDSLEELRATPILLASGSSVPLSELAEVSYGPTEPRTGIMRLDGEAVVAVGVVPRGSIDMTAFGKDVARELERATPLVAPHEVRVVFEQPRRLLDRLGELGTSLIQGTLIVAIVLVLFMGVRLGLLVAAVVPLVALISLAVYSWSGGVLHQISIAALVIALGLLVDNAIVMAESIQLELDGGASRRDALRAAVGQLATPLGTATGTTLAAFVPMLLAEGGTGDFTRAIPTVVMLTLVVSYAFAVVVTLVMAGLTLKRRNQVDATGGAFQKIGRLVGVFASQRPWTTLTIVAAMMVSAVALLPRVPLQFFPLADRDQLFIELELPEGTHVDRTDRITARFEAALARHEAVVERSAYVGGGVPRFYYNVTPSPNSPHRAQVVVRTRSVDDVRPLAAWVRAWAKEEAPEATIVPKILGQGPPVRAPIELRLYAEDLEDLRVATQAVVDVVSASDDVIDVRHDFGVGLPTMDVDIDDASAARQGVSRSDVAAALFGRTRGLPVGEYRGGDDPMPIVVRAPEGEFFDAQRLGGIDVISPVTGGRALLEQVAETRLGWSPAVVKRENRERTASVLSELRDGRTFSQALADIRPALDALELPEGARVSIEGAAAESGQANSNVLRNAPLATMLLLFFLLVEFNSFRRVGIILVTVPLAIVGVVPGLLIGGQPFGFMSLLGTLALIGILVNNAIVLIDQIEHRRGEGASIADAVRDAVQVRTRPILLTVMTTIAGMLPLALSNTSLWPPMAWTIIFGLVAATFLTLMVVPALYMLVFASTFTSRLPFVSTVTRVGAILAMAAAVTVGTQSVASAQELEVVTLERAMEMGASRDAARAIDAQADASQAVADIALRRAVMPGLTLDFVGTERAPTLELETPVGNFQQGERTFVTGTLGFQQPLMSASELYGAAPAAQHDAEAARLQAERTRLEFAGLAADAYLDVLAIDAQIAATQAFIASLEERLVRVRAAVGSGAAIENDAARLELSRDQAQQDAFALNQQRRVALYRLGQLMGVARPVAPAGLEQDMPDPASSIDEALEIAIEERPELSALRERRDAARARKREVRLEYIPRLTAGVAVQYTTERVVNTDWIVLGTVGLSLTPIASGTRRARVDAQEALATQASLERDAASRAIGVQVRQAWAQLETAQQGVVVQRGNVSVAQDNARIQTARLKFGSANVVDIVEADALVRQATSRLAVAEIDVVRAKARLLVAMGRRSW